MRRLMLFRHAKTERGTPGMADRDRQLMDRGRADAPVLGAYMADRDLIPDLALVSPAVRAQQTWTLAAAAFKHAPRVVTDPRIYNATTERLLAVITDTPETVRSVVVVGHNPGLHDVAVQLIASGDASARALLNDRLPTAGLVVIALAIEHWARIAPRSGKLECFVSPRLLDAD
jgi:phosphohistidine phosphatase